MCSAWTLANNRRQVQLRSAPLGWWLWLWYDALCLAPCTPPHRAAKVEQFPISKDSAKQSRSGDGVGVSLYPAAARYIDPATPLTTFSRQIRPRHCSLTCRQPGPGHPPGSGLQISHLANPHIHLARVRSIHHQPPGQGGGGDCFWVILLTKTIVFGVSNEIKHVQICTLQMRLST